MHQPLEGIKVLELAHWAAGPAASAILADWGADVIKVESLEGDGVRGMKSTGLLQIGDVNFLWEFYNHNKKSIAIDLKAKEALDITNRLMKNADILVSNFRPEALQKLHLDYETVNKINPRLIYASLSGYGHRGPDKDKRGFDYAAFWARSGVMATIGEPGTPLSAQRPAYGDHITAMFMAGGIALALFARERTGVGQELDISLLASGIWAMAVDIQASLTLGVEIPRLSRKKAGNPLYNCYEAKDGKWFQFVMLQTDPYWSAICQALGSQDLEHDPRFNSHAKRCEHNEELIDVIDSIIYTKNIEDWSKIFDRYGLIWGLVQTVAQVTSDPQVMANEIFKELNHPNHGMMKMVTNPVRLNKTQNKALEAAPELGQHTEEILLELGYDWQDIAKLKEKKVIL
ncbi:MAG: CaiB/BaiF CoA transferase family protein [Smithellaceae bacterium]